MKLDITDLETLEKNKDGYKFSIRTRRGLLTVEGIPTKEEALKVAEMHLKTIIKNTFKK